MSEFLKSTPVTNLDATPVVYATAGEGASGHVKRNTDSVAATTNVAQYSTYRLCRFPTNAKVKHVNLYTRGIDTTTGGNAGMDVNIAFSDSTGDGTPQALQGTIPSSRRDGTAYAYGTGATTTGYSTAYTSSATGNKLFGVSLTFTTSAAAAGYARDITFGNTSTTAGTLGFRAADRDDDLWNVMGFTNSQGAAQDPGGFFDLFVVMSGAVGTAAAGTIGLEIDYVI
jgi:hypothetical protein